MFENSIRESNDQLSSVSSIDNLPENSNLINAIAPSKYFPPAYIHTTKKQACTHCKDTSGKCGIGIPNKQHSLCYSVATRKAAEEIGKQGIYQLIEFSDEHGYAEFYRKVADWKPFDPVPNSAILVEEIDNLPKNFSITPLREKRPYRENWQNEETVDRKLIKSEIEDGHSAINKNGKEYTIYSSGYGLRTGDPSGGILAIDVDGSSAQPVLEKLSGGELPETVSFTSGKKGRQQLLFQIPEEYKEFLTQFTRAVVNQTDDLKCDPGEQLEFRYNRMQSCLPPSRHPDTGSYKWINSPEDIEIAIAPQWLLDLLPKLVAKEQEESSKKQKPKKQYDGSYAVGFSGDNNPYDSRNLIQYCEGYREKNNDWLAAKCPAHNGSSFDSLTVRRDNGRFYCFNKCCPTKIYKSLIELAKINGVVFPAKSKSNQKSPEQIAQDNAQFEAEKITYKELSKLDESKLKDLGITVKRINKQYLSPNDLKLEKGKISIVISAMGTRKTSAIAEIKDDFKSLYSYHTRNSLAWKMASDLGALHKEQAENSSFANRVAFCANSADKFAPRILKDKGLLLGDECDQLFAYFFEPLCNRDSMRPRLLSYHEAHLASALTNGSALYMSAHVAQKEIEYILRCAPSNTPIEVVINDFKAKRGVVVLSTDKNPEAVVSKLLKLLKQGIPCFVIDDNKNGYRGCKTIAQIGRQELKLDDISNSVNPDLIIEINSDTSDTEDIRNYIKSINERSTNTLLLVCSPSVISGISITNKRFNQVFGFFNGILTPKNASQALSRARGAENLTVWCAERGNNCEASKGITAVDVNNYYQKNHDARNKILDEYLTSLALKYDPISEEWHSHHWDLYCKNSALKNIEMRKLRYWLKEQLTDDGYQIEEKEFGLSPNVGDTMKEIWAGLKIEDVNEIKDAALISESRYEQLLNKSNTGENLSKCERIEITKYHLFDTFGQEIIDKAKVKLKNGDLLSGFAAIAYQNWGGGLEKAFKKFYTNFYKPSEDVAREDISGELRQANLRPDFDGCNQRFPGDIKWKLREQKMFEFLEFKQYLDPNKEYYPEDYKPLIDKVKRYVEPIKLATGYNFEKVEGGILIGLLYSMHGLKLQARQTTVDGERIRVKKITKESWEFAQNFVKHQTVRKEVKAGCTTPPTILIKRYFTGGLCRE